MRTNTFAVNIKKMLDGYVRVTSVAILPALYFAILYYLASRAISTAVFSINTTFAQKWSMAVIEVFSIYPILWLCASAKRFFSLGKSPLFTRVLHGILLAGIISAHVVTWLAVQAGQYDFYTFECLIRYDLIVLDIYVYWKSDREGVEIGLKILCILIWLSALYGIGEHFFPSKLVLFNLHGAEGRVKSFYTNPIISGSIWLIGFWLPFPSHKKVIRMIAGCSYIVAIFFTISKNTWIGLCISIVVYLIWNRDVLIKNKGKRHLLILFLITIVISFFVIFIFQIGKAYIGIVLSRWHNFQTQGEFLHRLYHVQDAIRYIIHDTSFIRKLFGFGNSLSREFIKTTPHFTGLTNLDNQYIISLYEFGIFGLICLVIWGGIGIWAAKYGNYWQKAAGMGITAMLFPIGTFDPFQWEIVTFLLLLLSVLAFTDLKIIPEKKDTKKELSIRVGLLGICSLGIWAWPYIISWCRTLYFSLTDLYPKNQSIVAVLFFVSGIICVASVVAYLFFMVISFHIPKKKTALIAALFSLVSVAWFIWGNFQITFEAEKLAPLINEEREVLDVINTASKGYVYEDRYPFIYQEIDDSIHASFFSGESIIPGDSTTIMTSGNYCSKKLLLKGYLFTYISKDHAIYTDDVKLIRALEALGLRFTAYYHDYESPEKPSDPRDVSDYDIHKFYDPVGRLIREEYYKLDGERVNNSNGYFAVTYTFDKLGNKTGELYFGTDGKEKINIWGYAEKKCFSNDFGQVFREEFYGPEGEPIITSVNAYAIDYERDLHGNIIEYRYYDKDNNLVKTTSGYAVLRRSYNNLRQIICDKYYGIDDKPVLVNGYHMITFERDGSGNPVCERYYDINETPVFVPGGYAVLRRLYNEKGQCIREMYYDAEDMPILIRGYQAVEYIRNDLGDVQEYRYYTSEGELVINTSGYAIKRHYYNDARQLERMEFYDIYDEPVLCSEGCFAIEYTYDKTGNIIEWRYYDAAGQLVISSHGYALMRRAYNERGQVACEEYYGVNEEPINRNGYQKVEYLYDTAGHLVEETRYTAAGELTDGIDGYAHAIRVFDDNGNLEKEYLYNAYGELIS